MFDDQSDAYSGCLSDYTDARLRVTIPQALNRILEQPSDSLKPLHTMLDARAKLSKLVDRGCNESFLLQTSLLYALLLFHQEQNRLAERGTLHANRRLGLVGLSCTRRDFSRHVKAAQQVAGRIEDFLAEARVPGGDLRDYPEVWLKFRKLPQVLLRYRELARYIGTEMDPVIEIRAKKLR